MLGQDGHSNPRLAVWIDVLDDVRARTKRYVQGLTAEQLAWHPNPKVESIGTLLLHIAAVEFSYIQEDIMKRPMGEEWKMAFPVRFDMPQVSGEPPEFYIGKLDEVRVQTLEVLGGLTDADLGRMIEPLEPGNSGAPPVEYSIEWILYHVTEHEAHHKGQVALMKRLLPG